MDYKFTNADTQRAALEGRIRALEGEHYETTVHLRECETVLSIMPTITDETSQDVREAHEALAAQVESVKTDIKAIEARIGVAVQLYDELPPSTAPTGGGVGSPFPGGDVLSRALQFAAPPIPTDPQTIAEQAELAAQQAREVADAARARAEEATSNAEAPSQG